jgi:hypothetical protein
MFDFHNVQNFLNIAHFVLRDDVHRHDRGFLSFQVVIRFVLRINVNVTTRPSAGRHYVHISCTEFWPNETINEERGHRYLFTSVCKVWLSRCRFLLKSRAFKDIK